MALSKVGKNQVDQSASLTVDSDLTVDTNTLYVDSTNNRVGVGTSSPSTTIEAVGSLDILQLTGTTGNAFTRFTDSDATSDFSIGADDNSGAGAGSFIVYDRNNTAYRMVIDSSGNLLVGTVDNNVSDNSGASNGGINIGTAGVKGVISAAAGQTVAYLNRLGSDGDIVNFRKDGTTVGSIGNTGTEMFIGTPSGSDGYIRFQSLGIVPCTSTGANSDGTMQLGTASGRFSDIYATNGTIQTSDANEKQQIAALTDAEITAAKAISALFKTFKWNDAVAEKSDAARTHTGVIAQDVQAAMTAAGLDAGDYAFFISSTWYVDADGNEVEADAEGAIEKNRKGIRYPELLAFVGAATEQRLANIETRLAALEAN